MRLFAASSYGYLHLKKMETSADVQGLLTALGEPRVQRSASKRGSVIISLNRLRATDETRELARKALRAWVLNPPTNGIEEIDKLLFD
jgi:hypothetical protein